MFPCMTNHSAICPRIILCVCLSASIAPFLTLLLVSSSSDESVNQNHDLVSVVKGPNFRNQDASVCFPADVFAAFFYFFDVKDINATTKSISGHINSHEMKENLSVWQQSNAGRPRNVRNFALRKKHQCHDCCHVNFDFLAENTQLLRSKNRGLFWLRNVVSRFQGLVRSLLQHFSHCWGAIPCAIPCNPLQNPCDNLQSPAIPPNSLES